MSYRRVTIWADIKGDQEGKEEGGDIRGEGWDVLRNLRGLDVGLLTMESHKAGKRHRKAVVALTWETEEGCDAVEVEEEQEADVVAPDGDGKVRGRQICEVCDLWLTSPEDMHIQTRGRKHKNLEEVKQLEGANRRLAEYNQQVYSERRI